MSKRLHSYFTAQVFTECALYTGTTLHAVDILCSPVKHAMKGRNNPEVVFLWEKSKNFCPGCQRKQPKPGSAMGSSEPCC